MQSKYSYFQIHVSTSHFCSHFIFILFPHSTKYQEVVRTVNWQLTIMNLQGQNPNSGSRNISGKHSQFYITILFLFMFLRKHFHMGIEDEWVTRSEWSLAKSTGVCPILDHLCSPGARYLSLTMVVDICVLMTLMLIFFFLMRAIVPIFLLESVLSPTKIGAPVTVPAIHDHEKSAGNLCSLSEHLLRTEQLSDRVS